jgi:hypothetical protein
MTLQREYRGRGYLVWLDFKEGKKVVKSPIDVEKLPPGKYRLV